MDEGLAMPTTTRAHKEVEENKDAAKHRDFMRAVLLDLQALERMLEEERFEKGVRRIGAEQEMFLIDPTWAPARGALKMLDKLADPHFTTELGLFQLEANCDPQLLAGDGITKMRAQLDELMDKARRAASELDMNVVLMGILPTMRKEDLGLDSMVPSPRYLSLNKIVTELRGGKFGFSIKGLDELIIEHDSVMLEACNSSFQVHLQVEPKEFARLYNLAQVFAGPLMAISANSPIVFGRRLWAETRIALFRQAVDTRSHTHHMRETEARVSFGTRWVQKSIVEIYQEDIARFRALVGTDLDEDPMAMLDRGEAPKLKALRLHNGTIYRWNRPCFGVTDGKPHLRIENRVMAAGPSVVDEVANAAFWLGAMEGMATHFEDITKHLSFSDVRDNFLKASKFGIDTTFTWFKDKKIPVTELILKELLPMAKEGLKKRKVAKADIDRYLDIVEERCKKHTTGARWALRAFTELKEEVTNDEAVTIVTAATIKNQQKNQPVHTWNLPTAGDLEDYRPSRLKVEEFMGTDLITAQKDDIVEMAAEIMEWRKIRYMPVEDKKGELVGLISGRLLLRHFAKNNAIEEGISTTVGDLMIEKPETTTPDTSILEAMQKMREFKIGCLPVVKGKELVGIITEMDFLRITQRLMERLEKQYDKP